MRGGGPLYGSEALNASRSPLSLRDPFAPSSHGLAVTRHLIRGVARLRGILTAIAKSRDLAAARHGAGDPEGPRGSGGGGGDRHRPSASIVPVTDLAPRRSSGARRPWTSFLRRRSGSRGAQSGPGREPRPGGWTGTDAADVSLPWSGGSRCRLPRPGRPPRAERPRISPGPSPALAREPHLEYRMLQRPKGLMG